ncbi:MAG TPA: hypothetical protein VK665_11540 [Candidatus Elarobacter sp.]|nr:hypothetical protein [Candidatus Elarobacter sp.]
MSAVRTAALAALLALGACAPAWRLPDGVLADPAERGKLLVGGIYASTDPNDPSCCGMQRRAEFDVEKDGPASDLAIQFYLPDIPFFRRHAQSAGVALDGRPQGTRCCFGPGMHTLLVRLPPALARSDGRVHVVLTMKYAFVPKEQHINGDVRSLSAILVQTDFRSL